jgi:hypothetical protein
MMPRHLGWILLPIVIGCGRAELAAPSREVARSVAPAPPSAAPSAGAMPATGQTLPKLESLQRKIIYKASVDLVVEDFSPVPDRIHAMVRKFSGYIAESHFSGSPGSPRSGRWTIRVPVEHYEGLLAEVQRLGEIRTVASRSEDASEEYYDVQSRVRNAKKQEERLLKLLDTATGKLEEVLKVENELARVRAEIERLEGRVRLLDGLAAMSTLEVSVEEIQRYSPEETPTYLTRVRRSFRSSLDLLASTAQGFSILLVAVAPWLAAFGVLFGGPWALARLWRRRKRRV